MTGSPMRGSLLRGAVESFDAERGTGTVCAPDGASYPFHCTAIADGSRTIQPGTDVTFVVMAGHLGRMEARELTPLRG